MDCLSHCLDSLWSINANEQSTSLCDTAYDLLLRQNDAYDLVLAGHIAGKAIEITGTNILHALSYPLTGKYGITHGEALGYFLPTISKFMGYDVYKVLERSGIGVWTIDKETINDAINIAYDWYDKIFDAKIKISKKQMKELFSL